MLLLTALCAYSQYEAGEARPGDPGQLPGGGGCNKPPLQDLIKKNPPCHHFALRPYEEGWKGPSVCVSAGGQRLKSMKGVHIQNMCMYI